MESLGGAHLAISRTLAASRPITIFQSMIQSQMVIYRIFKSSSRQAAAF